MWCGLYYMMKRIRTYIAMIMLAATGFSVSASSFTLMAAEEVSALLGHRESQSSREESPVAMTESGDFGYSHKNMGRNVSAMDMVSKVYGAVNPESDKAGCMHAAEEAFSLIPHEEEGDLWLDSADGYKLSYAGVVPDVAAMARFGSDDSLEEYCYFFLFPYTDSTKEDANRQQADFTGSLLQEIYDCGCEPGVNTDSDDMMEVTGSHDGSFLDIRLLDDNSPSNENSRYILMLIVRPNAYTAADDVAAL